MKIEDFEQSKKELEKQKQENNKIIALYDERRRMSKVNSFENKAITTLALSVFWYLSIFLTSSILIKNIGAVAFTNVIPALSYPAIVVGSSLGIGALINSLINKKYKTKERYKSFSSAKTKTEKLEEEVHYQIELEKVNNRNKAIDETIKVLESNQAILNKMSSRYELNDKNAPQTKEQTEIRVSELSNVIKGLYDKLDILTTQKVLHDNFWRIKSKFQKRIDIMLATMIAGMFTMIFTELPLILVTEAITYSSSFTSLATIFTPFIVGVVVTSGYMIKRNKSHKKVFINLNSQLGENALTDTYEKYDGAYVEQEEIKALIEAHIRDISLVEVQLQENKRYLDTFLSEKNKKRAILEQPFSQLKKTDKTREDVSKHPEKFISCDVRTYMEKFYTDKEYEQKRNEVLTQPLPGDEEKGSALVKKKNSHKT